MKYFKGSWKPVTIDTKLFSGDIKDLVGIEECANYDFEELSPKLTTANRKRVRKSSGGFEAKKRKKEINEETKPEEQSTITPSKSGATLAGVCINESSTENFSSEVTEWRRFNLPEPVLKALWELGYTEPTPIQALTLPAAILGRRDILGAAETGSGKTLAFGLPILTGILKIKEHNATFIAATVSDSDESDFENDVQETGCVKLINNVDIKETSELKPLYALILTPTRELAIQVKNHLASIAKYTGINTAVVIGGMAAVKQERILSKSPEIVVATPGRLWEMIQQGNLHLSQVDNIRFLAIDETDRMLEKGHFQELQALLERINQDKTRLKQRQTFVFSATLTLIHELPNYLKNKTKLKKSNKIHDMTSSQKLQKIVDMLGMTDTKVVDISDGKGTSETLTECKITCNIDEKDYYLFYFLKRHLGRTLVFCNSIGCVKRLAALLSLLNCNPLPLHASMQQRQRLKNLERFRDNENSILIATDVAARGLDIPKIDHVLHYQTPRTSESYVHRSGRTARASREGITVLLIEPNELQSYLKMCRTLGKGEDLPSFPIEDNYLNAVKDRINLARYIDKYQLQVKKANSESGWLQRAAEEMDIIVDDISRKYDSEEVQGYKKVLETKRKQLSSLLNTPIFPKGSYNKYPFQSGEVSSMNDKNFGEKAVDVVKDMIKQNSTKKVRPNRLFKSKRNVKQNVQVTQYKFNKRADRTGKKKSRTRR